jgi:hypothetical protein
MDVHDRPRGKQGLEPMNHRNLEELVRAAGNPAALLRDGRQPPYQTTRVRMSLPGKPALPIDLNAYTVPTRAGMTGSPAYRP